MDKKKNFETRLKVMEDIGRSITDLMDKEEKIKELLPRLTSGMEMVGVLVQSRAQTLVRQQEEILEKIEKLPEGEDQTSLQNRMQGLSVRHDEAAFILKEIHNAVEAQKMNSVIQNGKFEGAQAALRVLESAYSMEKVLAAKWEKEQQEEAKAPQNLTKAKARSVRKVRDLMDRKKAAKARAAKQKKTN